MYIIITILRFADDETLRQTHDIVIEAGTFYQIRNDYLDCFDSLKNLGKIGTDIQDNKLSWLAVSCMERANDEQKQIMIDCYGQNGTHLSYLTIPR